MQAWIEKSLHVVTRAINTFKSSPATAFAGQLSVDPVMYREPLSMPNPAHNSVAGGRLTLLGNCPSSSVVSMPMVQNES